MFRTVLLTVAAVAATAEPLRGPAQMQLVALAEEAAFLGKRGLLPTQRWSLDQSSSGRRLHDVDSIPGQGACQFKDGECIVDGKYFAKLGAIADLSVAVQDLDLCTSFDNFDGSCNDFVNPPGRCMTVFMGPVVNGLACVPVNSTADSSDFETGFDIQPSFGSLGNFLDEACPEFSVLEKTSGPICNTTFVALLSILGCRTCISELLEVQGPVADACGAYATLDACTSDEATAAARLVLCGDDPSCARVSPNSVDNPLDRFYGYGYGYDDYSSDYNVTDYSSDYNATDYAPLEYLPVSNDYSTQDYDATGDYSASAPYDYSSGEYNPGDYNPGDYDGAIIPSGGDYSITGFDYGFYADAPIPIDENGAAYAPPGYYDYSARAPDVRDLLEGYLANIYSDPYDPYAYTALPVDIDEQIFYGHELFELEPGNPWEGEAAAPPITVPIPEAIRNITVSADDAAAAS
eukprot:jgi/Ulvmu1/1281/UM011_0005.1